MQWHTFTGSIRDHDTGGQHKTDQFQKCHQSEHVLHQRFISASQSLRVFGIVFQSKGENQYHRKSLGLQHTESKCDNAALGIRNDSKKSHETAAKSTIPH